MTQLGCRSVCWFEVYEFVDRLLTSVGSRPTAGTPAWCALDDDDPRKLDAVLVLGVHMALRIDAEQHQRADASREVSRAADWSLIARNIQRRNSDAYIHRRTA